MAKYRLPKSSVIVKIQLLIGRILVTTKSGKQYSYRYEDLTPKQENKLRSLAGPLPRRRIAPKHRETGHPRKRTNYAELVTGRSVLVNSGSNFGVMEM